MPARKTYSYGPGDASAYYTALGGANGDAWLSLYIYPAKLPPKEEAASIEAALLQHMPGRLLAAPAGMPALPAAVAEKWYDATIEGTALTKLNVRPGFLLESRNPRLADPSIENGTMRLL